jgi:hypothetical protein
MAAILSVGIGRASADHDVEHRIAQFWQRVDALGPGDLLTAADLGQWALNVIERDPGAGLTVADFRASTAAMQAAFDRAGVGIPPGVPKSADVEGRIGRFWAKVDALGPTDLLSAADLGQWALNVTDRDPNKRIRVDDFRSSTAGMQGGLERSRSLPRPATPMPTRTPTPTPTPTIAPTPRPIARGIANVETFLSSCPQRDPLFTMLTADFTIRRDGIPVTVPACSGQYSTGDPARLADEVIWTQVLRAAYYMDRGQTVAYPWVAGSLYSWWKGIAGINIDTTMTAGGGFCCVTFAGGSYMVSGPFPTDHRDYYQTWKAMSGLIGFVSHEVRHLNGPGHVDCFGAAYPPSGLAGGCDARFDESSAISSYGVQYWLERAWLTGTINVGIACLSEESRNTLAQWHLNALNYQFRDRFMSAQPALIAMPVVPGGSCGG